MDTFESKVRVTIPDYIIEILHTDMYDFDLSKNALCNRIFFAFYLTEGEIIYSQVKSQAVKILQFTLNHENLDILIDSFPKQLIQSKADYFRRIIFAYCNQPRYLRELSLNERSLQKINQAISQQAKLRIRYKDALRVIEPYAVLRSDNETRNYVYCYCYNHQDYCNYRLSNIDAVSVMLEPAEFYDQELVDGVKKNFDPFLSHGQVVKARLTETGRQIYASNITHRPRIIQHNHDIYEFECSEIRAKLYFPQFLGEIEILEPLSLREYFKAGSLKMYALYQS